jgi:hypothetical protein
VEAINGVNTPYGMSFLRYGRLRACICKRRECIIAFTERFHDICHTRAKEVTLSILSLAANAYAGYSRRVDPDERAPNYRSFSVSFASFVDSLKSEDGSQDFPDREFPPPTPPRANTEAF